MKEEIALELCNEIREKKIFGLSAKFQCWGCIKFGSKKINGMCLYNASNFEGCQFINRLATEKQIK